PEAPHPGGALPPAGGEESPDEEEREEAEQEGELAGRRLSGSSRPVSHRLSLRLRSAKPWPTRPRLTQIGNGLAMVSQAMEDPRGARLRRLRQRCGGAQDHGALAAHQVRVVLVRKGVAVDAVVIGRPGGEGDEAGRRLPLAED